MSNRTARKILLAVAVPVFLFSSVMVFKYHREMHIGAEYVETVVEMAVTPSTEPFGDQSIPAAVNETADIVPIQVDFDVLSKENQDVIGWLYCPDTSINYPVVQAADNEYYLHRLLDDSKNAAGTLFMDYRNSADLSDWNSVIYGHNMKNGSMFGSLRQYRTQSHYEANPHIYMTDGETIRRYEIFAAFEAEVTGYTYRLDMNTPEKKQALLDYSLARSVIDTEAVPTPEDAVITLSTCTGNGYDTRWVVQAVLTGQFPVQTPAPAAPAAEHCNGSLPESGGTDG